jgi:hypothetical protein
LIAHMNAAIRIEKGRAHTQAMEVPSWLS